MSQPSFLSADVARTLATLTADEITATRAALEAAGLAGPETHYSYVGLVEPDKRPLLDGAIPPRLVRAFLIDMATGLSHDVTVDPAAASVVAQRRRGIL